MADPAAPPPRTSAGGRDVPELEGLAWLMDRSIPVPGTRRRFGVDAVLGLAIPVVGDAIGAGVGLYLIARALQYRLPRIVVVRMVFNTLLDLVIGAIPLLGDLFDFAFQANMRNMALLRAYAREPERSTTEHKMFLAGVGLVVLGLVVLAVMLLVRLLEALVGLLSAAPLLTLS